MSRLSLDYVFLRIRLSIKSEANQFLLNYIWWILMPIVEMGVFYFVFSKLFNQSGVEFVVFLWIGTVVWSWLSNSINNASMSIVANKYLIKEVYIPKFYFPFITIGSDFCKQLVVFFVLFVGIISIWDLEFSFIHFINLATLIFLSFVLIASISTFVALIVPIIPDIKLMLNSFLLLLMFCSGIFYDISSLPENVQIYFIYNPVALLLILFRELIIEYKLSDLDSLIYIALISLVFSVVSFGIYKYFDKSYSNFIK